MTNYTQGLRDAMDACQGVRESGCEGRAGAVECIDAINSVLCEALAAPSVASAAKGDELPPLPVIPAGYSRKSDYDPQGGSPLFSVDQMRADARAAALAEREAIARQIEGDVGIGALGAAIQVAIAATIRARN